MTRLNFLKWLGWGGLTSFVTPPLPLAHGKSEPRQIVLLTTFIAGFRYHDGMDPDVFGQLREGAPLDLKREPDNAYDSNALAALTPGGRHLGYIPKSKNAMLARILDQGAGLGARVARLDPDAPAWERLEIEVSVSISTPGGIGLKAPQSV